MKENAQKRRTFAKKVASSAFALSLAMSLAPLTAFAEGASSVTNNLGTVSLFDAEYQDAAGKKIAAHDFEGGSVANATGNAVVTFADTAPEGGQYAGLTFKAADDSLGRPAAYWMGFRISQPQGVTNFQISVNGGEFSGVSADQWIYEKDNATPFFAEYCGVTYDTLQISKNKGENKTWTYAFDWDNDSKADQTITVIADVSKIKLAVPADGACVHESKQDRYTETRAATCEVAGAVITLCDTCGQPTGKEKAIPATGHTWGDAKWTWEAGNSSASVTTTCSACDKMEAAKATVESTTAEGKTTLTATATLNGAKVTNTKTVTALADAKIIEGENAVGILSENKGLTFRSDAPLALLKEVRVDNKVVDPTNYDLAEGSTKVTLHKDFLATLGEGEHAIDIVSYAGDGKTEVAASTTFALKAQAAKEEQKEPTVGAVTMYRLYNPNSGEHFYTADTNERANVLAAGWNDEGIGWTAPDVGDDVYRLYNKNGGEHHYTVNAAEKDMLVAAGWTYEGVGWKSGGAVKLLREYNPNEFANNHNYTKDTNEHAYLVGLGWKDEGIAWYGIG